MSDCFANDAPYFACCSPKSAKGSEMLRRYLIAAVVLHIVVAQLCERIEIQYFDDGEEDLRTGSNRSIGVLVKKRDGVKSEDALVGKLVAECRDLFGCHVVESAAGFNVNLNEKNNWTQLVNVTVVAEFLGYNDLQISCNGSVLPESSYRLRILRSSYEHVVAKVFTVFVTIFVTGITFLMGTQLELSRIKGIMRRPVGPLTGFFCQFFVMPSVGFTLASLLLPEDQPAIRFALFAASCSPGGGKSSFWTIIYDGNLDLSVAMTFTQTISALFMMPLYIYTFGQHFFSERVHVPFDSILESLLILIVPSVGGMIFISYKKHLVEKLNRWIKIATWASTVLTTVFGVYANWYVIYLFRWYIVLAGCALPWSGYVLAYIIALVTRQQHRERITITIETGIQNIGISMIMLLWSLPEPEVDLALVMPLTIILATDKPLMLIWLIRKCFCRNGTVVEDMYKPEPPGDAEKSEEKSAEAVKLEDVKVNSVNSE
uniref:Ileal sodium/bile acid cotransporter n=1 Tax=Steinernema glaseri TaxID=37863 RepID=A0A1I8AU12_9BILA